MNFYLDLYEGQIEHYMPLMLSYMITESSPLKGWIHRTYCSKCDSFVNVYEISDLEYDYDPDTLCNLMRLLIPLRETFIERKINNHNYLKELIMENPKPANKRGLFKKTEKTRFDKVESYLNVNKRYFKEILQYDVDVYDINIDEYIEEYESELNFIKNSVSCINLPKTDYNVNLNGERISMYSCPSCGNDIYTINSENPCPKCGGEMETVGLTMLD